MRILMVSAEVAPYAKTGGLADVTTALAKSLSRQGHEIAIVLPKYLMVDRGGYRTEPIDIPLLFRIDNEERTGWIHRTTLPGTSITVYFVVNDHFFNRNGLYQEGGKDYPDNLARFTFFCRSVLEIVKSGEFPAQILHCHDWQTALVPTFLKTTEKDDPILQKIKTVFTYHNLAYQGFFPSSQLPATGLPWNLFNPDGIEFYGDINLLKGGFVFADHITTVSERYAAESLAPEYGCGMETIVQAVQHKLTGILNGADYEAWNPETDPLIPKNYGPESLEGKLVCKLNLQKEFNLPESEDIPLLVTIGRLDDHKGPDLTYQAMETFLLGDQVQFICLGTGKPEYERLFHHLRDRFPYQVGVRIGYDEELAHRIEAGGDILLMPSRSEPCGLTQLYGLKYGTIPVVRLSGGLADTIQDYNELQKDGYGFVFVKQEVKEYLHTIRRAISVFRDKTAWSALQKRAMACDYSWSISARKYEDVYRQLLEDTN